MKLIVRGISQDIDLYSPETAEAYIVIQSEETEEVFKLRAPLELVNQLAELAAREVGELQPQEEEDEAGEEAPDTEVPPQIPQHPQRKRLSAQAASPRNHVPPARRAPASEDEVPPL